MKKFKLLVLILFLLSTAWASSSTLIHLDSNHLIKAEVVSTPHAMAQGLMWRKQLDAQSGMLFVYPKSIPSLTFWMKNMLIPIDIIWLDDSKRITYYEDNVPPCRESKCPLYAPPANIPNKYVLEIKAGQREKLKLRIMQQLDFKI